MKNDKVNSNIIYNATKWSMITNILRKLIAPITNMILARILTPDAFGIVATINIVISFADIFTDAGFQKYIVQHEFKDDKEYRNAINVAFWTNLVLSVFIWLLICVFRNQIAILVGSEGYGLHLSVAAFVIPLYSFSSIQQSIFKRKFDFKSMFVARIVNSLIPFFVTIPIALVTKNCWALIIGTLASAISDAILLTLKSKWRPTLYYSFQELKKMFSFTIWTMLEQISIWFTLNIDVFILGLTISTYYLGLYKTSLTTIDQIFTLITTAIIPVLFSALSRFQYNDEKFKNTFYAFQKKSAIILIPMGVGILIYSDVVTWILLGEQWEEAAIAIGTMGMMQVFRIIFSSFASEVYRAKGEPKISFYVQIIYMLIIIPLIIWGARKGFEILCFAKAASIGAFVIIQVVVLKIRYKFSICQMFKNILYPIIASMIMAIVCFVLHSNIENMLLKTASIVICIIVYFAVCMAIKDTRETILEIVRSRKHNMDENIKVKLG